MESDSAAVQESDPLHIRNYRLIAQADTLTKLYIGLLADCMTDYAECHDILSTGQEGVSEAAGSPDADCAEQCKFAWRRHLFHVCGFQLSIQWNKWKDHNELFIIYGLVFPEDCIEAVKDIDQDAKTSFKLSAFCFLVAKQDESNSIVAQVKESLSHLLLLLRVHSFVGFFQEEEAAQLRALRKESLCSHMRCTAQVCMQMPMSH